MLDARSILVTGGSGTFGRAFAREVLRRHRPAQLVVLDRDEQRQHDMAQELSPAQHPCLRYRIGDVRDRACLERAFVGIDFVVHAAAMNQVPSAEHDPVESIRTNVYGSQNVIDVALDAGVERVVAVSSDKASNPLSLCGATKLAADKCFIAANHLSDADGARFAVVRLGNVFESRGGVVRHFQQLVADGARTLPITDERMTRFWITLRDAVAFVLERLAAMSGGEVFVPRLPSLRIVDLARALGPGCELVCTGIRPGEKLHEVLLPRDESRQALEFARHFTVYPAFDDEERSQIDAGERGQPLPDGFEYASDTNSQWVGAAEIEALLGGEPAAFRGA